MAKSLTAMEKSLEELEKEIMCAICQEHYTDPKVLPCCHYYCKQCIVQLSLRTGTDKPFSCPECRATFPQGKVDLLPTAFFINRMKEKFARLEQAYGKSESLCELCSEDKSKALCRQCEKFLCSKCTESHRRMKTLFSGHQTIALAELDIQETSQMFDQESSSRNCAAHDEPLKVYCFDCKCLICRDCTVRDHNGHNCEFNNIAAPVARKELAEKLKQLLEIKAELSGAIKDIKSTQAELDVQEMSIARTIEKTFEDLVLVLMNRKQELLKKASSEVRQKKQNLSLQEDKLNFSSAVVQNVNDYADHCVKLSPDDEIMCMHAEIEQQMCREVEEHAQRTSIDLEPVEEVNTGVETRCAEALKQFCQTSTNVVQLPVIYSLCCDSAEVNRASKFILSLKHSNGVPKKQTVSFCCQMKSLVDKSTLKCDVTSIGGGQYCIKYTPTVRGRHELEVFLNEQQVAGSSVFVSISPTQLGTPVKVLGGLVHPIGITVNSEGQTIIAEHQGDVVVFNQDGSRNCTLKKSNHKFSDLSGVAVDGNNNIYLTTFTSNHIYKYDKVNEKMQVHKVEQVQGPGHWGICMLGNKVVVCERKNNGDQGGIVIYNKQLQHIQQIDGRFNAISTNNGKIFATSHDMEIKRFSGDGIYLDVIKCNNKKLSGVYGMGIFSAEVYVADTELRSITVFSTEGVEIASFGKKGSGKGDFDNPRGVFVNTDGFVYVCDNLNNLVQIF